MQTEMMQLVAVAVVIAPVTTGFTEMYKQYTPAGGRWLPVLSLVTGVVFGLLCALAFGHTNLLLEYGLAGLLSGLSATGFYQLVKPTTGTSTTDHLANVANTTAAALAQTNFEVSKLKKQAANLENSSSVKINKDGVDISVDGKKLAQTVGKDAGIEINGKTTVPNESGIDLTAKPQPTNAVPQMARKEAKNA